MSNYNSYPKHRLKPNSCIICFNQPCVYAYSFTELDYPTKKYLYESNYLDNARNIVLMYLSGKKFNFTKDSFIEWLKKQIEK